MGLVPLIAIAAVLFDYLPLSDVIVTSTKKFLVSNLLPDKSGKVIVRYVGNFADKADRLPAVGVFILICTALAQMLTIEHAFNRIWAVKDRRPFFRRLIRQLMALLLGPIVFSVSIALTTYLVTLSSVLIDKPVWLFRLIWFVFLAALLALLYWQVPSGKVRLGAATIGGVLAALGFAILQWVFASYISALPTFRVVYGTFSAVPIFLGWLYLSWSVILLGALATAELDLFLSNSSGGNEDNQFRV